jgi:hypothetical protein
MKTFITLAWNFEIFILSEREVYHDICHIAISKIVKFHKDYPQTGEDVNFCKEMYVTWQVMRIHFLYSLPCR